jgi:post-segregation antitoxin (ccd killing protein)
MARQNIYVGDELGERLKAHGDSINVSKVCQAALTAELNIADARAKATEDLAPTVERLSRTREEKAREAFANGHEVGLGWARSTATWDELSSLAFHADASLLYVNLGEDHSLPGYLMGRALDSGHEDAEPDWFMTLRDNPYDRGLLKGAMDVFRAVRDLVPEPESEA